MKIYQCSCETHLNIMGVKGKKTYTSDYKRDGKSRSPGLGALFHDSYISARTRSCLLNG